MRLLHHDPHTESVGHDGEQYERDEHGAFELPHELAADLLERFPHLWSVAPEPVPAEPVKPKRGTKPKQEPETVTEDEGSKDEDPAKTEETEKSPADATGSKEGDGGDSSASEAPKGRASSRKASA